MREYNELLRKDVLNWLLFDLLDGSDLVLRVHDPLLGVIETDPFKFKSYGDTVERIITGDEYIMMVRLNDIRPTVTVRMPSEQSIEMFDREYPIHTMIPDVRADGVVVLEVISVPLSDIDSIVELYQNIRALNTHVISLLGMKNHPIFDLDGSGGILGMLYELDIQELYDLSQLSYLLTFEEILDPSVKV